MSNPEELSEHDLHMQKVRASREPLWATIYDTIREHKMSNMVYEEGDEYGLVDLMSSEDAEDISDGELQMVALSDSVFNAIMQKMSSDVLSHVKDTSSNVG